MGVLYQIVLIVCCGALVAENEVVRDIDATPSTSLPVMKIPSAPPANMQATETITELSSEDDVEDNAATERPIYLQPVLPFLMFCLVIVTMVVTGKLYANVYTYHKNSHTYAIPLPHCPPRGCPDHQVNVLPLVPSKFVRMCSVLGTNTGTKIQFGDRV